MRLKTIILWLCLLWFSGVYAQEKPKMQVFKSQRAVLFKFNYGYNIPAADLAKRFGSFSSLGGGISYKTAANWELRFEANVLFGPRVKENDVLYQLRNKDGYLIDQQGYNLNPVITMRGGNFCFQIGKIFPLTRNRNSGIYVSAGAGFLQHRIFFQKYQQVAPQIEGAYRKGYDRLTNGMTTNVFIGYQHLSIKKLINFFAGIEYVGGNTQYARNYAYDLMSANSGKRNDTYIGVKFGWMVPIYLGNKGEKEFYYH